MADNFFTDNYENNKRDTKNDNVIKTQEYDPRPLKEKKVNFLVNYISKNVVNDFKSIANKKRLSHPKLLEYLIDFYKERKR